MKLQEQILQVMKVVATDMAMGSIGGPHAIQNVVALLYNHAKYYRFYNFAVPTSTGHNSLVITWISVIYISLER